MQAMVSLARQVYHDAMDFAFPPQCLFCDRKLRSENDSEATTTGVCAECNEKLVQNIEHGCPRCAARVGPFSQTGDGCVHCRRKDLRFNSAICLGMYEEHLRTAMLSAKWSFSRSQMQALTALLWQNQAASLSQLKAEIVLPIPQHWQQRLTRYFNPAWIIADTLASQLSVPCDVHILRRRRRTRPQKRVALNQRFDNQRDAFRLRDAHIVKEKTVLLVDDVLTTGATCSEATRLLKAAGAKACHVAVIGRVLDHSA